MSLLRISRAPNRQTEATVPVVLELAEGEGVATSTAQAGRAQCSLTEQMTRSTDNGTSIQN